MDLAAIRADLATVAGECGFNAWAYEPDDPQDLPAAVVGSIKSMIRLNRLVTQIDLGVKFYVNCADAKDAAERLDIILSTGVTGSFADSLDAILPTDTPSWRSIRWASAGAYQRVSMPGGSVALVVEITLELTA